MPSQGYGQPAELIMRPSLQTCACWRRCFESLDLVPKDRVQDVLGCAGGRSEFGFIDVATVVLQPTHLAFGNSEFDSEPQSIV